MHLPGQYMHSFQEDEPIAAILERSAQEFSSLTAFFNYNHHHPEEPPRIYHDFPKTHVYSKTGKQWKLRQRGSAVGQIFIVHPTAGELYYLQLILITVPSPKSFEDLRTINGVLHATFKDACIAQGQLGDDCEQEHCLQGLQEAALSQSGYQLQLLFVQILVFCEVIDPVHLWTRFQVALSDDLHPRDHDATSLEQYDAFAAQHTNIALIHIQILLRNLGKTLSDYQCMPEPVMMDQHNPSDNPLITDELSYPLLTSEEIITLEHGINDDQQHAYNQIKHTTYEMNTSEAFFIDGPAGTGKTFLYPLILSMVQSNHDIALAVAGSGIAALLLQGGMTAHS